MYGGRGTLLWLITCCSIVYDVRTQKSTSCFNDSRNRMNMNWLTSHLWSSTLSTTVGTRLGLSTDSRDSGASMPLLNAVLIGGTGAVGRCLLGSLLQDKDRVRKVTVITRRKIDNVAESYDVDVSAEEAEGRLVQHVEDLDDVSDDTVRELCAGSNVFFNCLGTTKKIAGSTEAFRHIDYEIPLRLIKLAKQADVSHCSVVTSQGSSPSSWIYYLKTKGDMETSIRDEQFEYTSIFRPGLLDRGEDKRWIEKISGYFVRSMPVASVAQAMLVDALDFHTQRETGEEENKGASSNAAVFNNADINRICAEAVAE